MHLFLLSSVAVCLAILLASKEKFEEFGLLLQIVPGAVAKSACSGIFISNFSIEFLRQHELSELGNEFMEKYLINLSVDYDRHTVTAVFFYFYSATAHYYGDPFGCRLVSASDTDHTTLRRLSRTWQEQVKNSTFATTTKINEEVQRLVKRQFIPRTRSEIVKELNLPNTNESRKWIERMIVNDSQSINLAKSRGIVVMHHGEIIGEAYSDPITENSRLLGWSMTKSVLAVLIGARIAEGKMSLGDIIPLTDSLNHSPRVVTVKDVLQMRDGICEKESHSLVSPTVRMLFVDSNSSDLRAVNVSNSSMWHYCSKSTNVLSLHLRRSFSGNDSDYWLYPFNFFKKLGITTMNIEVDPSGNFVGSSFGFATVRDWAKIGQLYLQNGKWNGEQLLPTGWVQFCTKLSMGSSGTAGAHWWRNPFNINSSKVLKPNADESLLATVNWKKKLPANLYSAEGKDGQFVLVFPSSDLVIARIGYTRNINEMWNVNYFLKNLLQIVSGKI